MIATYSRARDGNTQLAPNFRVREFASRCGTDEILIDRRLPDVLQEIRGLLGDRALNVTSAYRSPAHNRAVGGATNSRHMVGDAADIQQHGTDLIMMCRAAETALANRGIGGCIVIYPNRNFIHVDLRAARWRGEDISDGRGARTVNGWQPLQNNTPAPTPPQPQPQPSPTAPSNSVDELIWNHLKVQGFNDFGIAGMMGNLFAESAYRPNALENAHQRRIGMNSEQYTAAVDNGSYTREQFMRDSAGYGLSQWTFHTRKAGLYDLVKERGVSIADVATQMEWLMRELAGEFRAVRAGMTNAESVRQASDLVLTRFMRPADMGERVQIRRAGYGLEAYNKFAGNQQAQFVRYEVRVDVNGLNVRTGPGTNHSILRINNENAVIRDRRVVTIQEEASGPGASRWGRIESNEFRGWISLDHIVRL